MNKRGSTFTTLDLYETSDVVFALQQTMESIARVMNDPDAPASCKVLHDRMTALAERLNARLIPAKLDILDRSKKQ